MCLKSDIYERKFVENLFNRMSKTYGIVNYISSFGFTERWRRQCVSEIDWTTGMSVGFDLMSGMGECWGLIKKASGNVKLTGVDISKVMNQKAAEKLIRHPDWKIEIREEDILNNQIESESADFIISSFGIKTFSDSQQDKLAYEIGRILKRGGQVSMIEVSVPKSWFLRPFYMFYIKKIIPLVGKLFMGNSEDYRMLGIYCEAFGDCRSFQKKLENNGLDVRFKKYFFGCATGIIGTKP